MIKVHEHTIEVTNSDDPLFKLLTVSNLLRHLEHYAKHPHEYFEPIESSEVKESFEDGVHVLDRVLHFSSMDVKDRVSFLDNHTMVTDIEHTENYPGSRLTIEIKTLELKNTISLHFLYEEDIETAPQENIFLSLRRKAYEQKDQEMVERIRQQAGRLSELS